MTHRAMYGRSKTDLHLALVGGTKDGNYLFNDTLNAFYSRLYSVAHIVRVYSFLLAASALLYASSHKQDRNIPRFVLHQSWSTGCNEK